MPIFTRLLSCFCGGPDVAADLEVVKAAPIHPIPAGNLVTRTMAKFDKSAIEAVHIFDEQFPERDQINPGKRRRAEAVARVTDRPLQARYVALQNGKAELVVLDGAAGNMHVGIQIVDDHGKAPMRLDRHSKRSRIVTIDLTDGNDDEGGHHRPGSSAPVKGLAAGFERHSASEGAVFSKSEQNSGPAKAAADRQNAMGEAGLQASLNNSAVQWHDQEEGEPIDVSGSQVIYIDGIPLDEILPPERPQTFSCAVCYDDHPMEDCFIASMCRHKLCREAAREVVLGAIKSCTFPVLCPICQAKADPPCVKCERRRADAANAAAAGEDGGAANGPAAWCCSFDADIPVLLSVEEEEQYLQRSLIAATNACPDLLPCPKAGCQGVAAAGGEDDSPKVVCNVCKHEWCKACRVDWHYQLSCDEYQRQVGEQDAEKGLLEYEAANRIVRCPTCGHGMERTSGCNRLTCVGCRTQVCWLCGDKLPATNPYSHFTTKGCAAYGGGQKHTGAGVPAGAWAGTEKEVPAVAGRAAAAQPIGAANAHQAAPQHVAPVQAAPVQARWEPPVFAGPPILLPHLPRIYRRGRRQ